MLIHNPIFTGSISLNGSDISQVSTVSTDSSSFASRITNNESTSSAFVVASGSFSNRIANTESTASAFITASGSFSTRTTAVEATASQLVTASGSLAARLTSNEAKTGSFATTGSNQFNGSQTVTGSLTATGTIIAQTLVVQTVTSSVVYSSGSNIFGLNSGNSHQFTGSVLVSGSQTINGALSGTSAVFSGKATANVIHSSNGSDSDSGNFTGFIIGGSNEANARTASIIKNTSGDYDLIIRSQNATSVTTGNIIFQNGSTTHLTIASTGAATFSSSVTAGSTSSGAQVNVFASSYGNNGLFNAYGTDGNIKLQMGGLGTNEAFIYTGASNKLSIFTGGATSMTITSAGNVGIGTTAPSEKLHIAGNAYISGVGSILYFDTDASSKTISQYVTNLYEFHIVNGRGNSAKFVLGNGSISLGTNATPQLFINTSNGFVGIGTSTLNSRLAVQGEIAKYCTTSGVDGGFENLIKYGFSSDLNTSSATNARWIGIDASVTAGAAAGNILRIRAYPGGTGNSAPVSVADFRGDQSSVFYGNVGIGITSPTTRLSVSGTGNVVSITSSDNSLSLALGYQGTMHGYLGGFSSRLEAYSNNGGYVLLNSSSVWVAASDVKRKRNFEQYNLGLNEILGLKPSLYNMDFQEDGDEKQVGLIAQEVKDYIPLAYEENDKFIGLNYNAIIVTMVNAIKELKAELDTLKNA